MTTSFFVFLDWRQSLAQITENVSLSFSREPADEGNSPDTPPCMAG